MNVSTHNSMRPDLRETLRQASACLAKLEGERLEELADYCALLVNDETSEERGQENLDRVWREAWKEMAIFVRVLEATQSNLNVMRRLREIHNAKLEYDPGRSGGVLDHGSDHGDD